LAETAGGATQLVATPSAKNEMSPSNNPRFVLCCALVAGLLPFASAAADDFSYGQQVSVAGNALICATHDDMRLLDFALRKNDMPQVNFMMKAGRCRAVQEHSQIADCEFSLTLGPRFALVRCASGQAEKAKMRDLYVYKFDLVSKTPKTESDDSFAFKFNKDRERLKAQQEALEKELRSR
jgi:hypothetical protein